MSFSFYLQLSGIGELGQVSCLGVECLVTGGDFTSSDEHRRMLMAAVDRSEREQSLRGN